MPHRLKNLIRVILWCTIRDSLLLYFTMVIGWADRQAVFWLNYKLYLSRTVYCRKRYFSQYQIDLIDTKATQFMTIGFVSSKDLLSSPVWKELN